MGLYAKKLVFVFVFWFFWYLTTIDVNVIFHM